MLVTFSCDAHENITMLGDDAIKLIKMMGHSGTIPSAILAEDVPAALSQLKKAVANQKSDEDPNNYNDDEFDEQSVGLATRAWPLLELLEAAAEAKSNVMWQKK